MLQNKIRTLGEFKGFAVNHENEGEKLVEDFLVLSQRFGTSHQSFCELGGLFNACRLIVSD